MKALTYRIHFTKEPEGSYTATVPTLPGCITYGETIEQAVSMAKEAIELYVEHMQEKGERIPDDSNVLEYSIQLQTA